MPESIGPFSLEPVVLEKIWGGNRLAKILGLKETGAKIGEAWLCSDMPRTSGTGAGGQAVVSRISDGWMRGHGLDEVLRSHAREVLGRASDSFPLLVKLLDSTRPLSVQVHPSRNYAALHPEAAMKHEAWLVLHAEPGATIITGVRELRGEAELKRAAASREFAGYLKREAVEVGDVVDVPTGTVHALGAGLTVLEVQTTSDTTFRLYDWAAEFGETGRPLHVDEASRAADLRFTVGIRKADRTPGTQRLLDVEAFALSRVGAGDLQVSELARIGKDGRPGGVLLFPFGAGCETMIGDARFALAANRVTVVPATVVMRTVLVVPAGQSVALIAMS